MSELVSGDLTLSVAETPSEVVVAWSGRSTLRDPDAVLGPFLADVVEKRGSRRVCLDFRALGYMNSSTLVPIAKLVRRAAAEGIPVTVRYLSRLSWQRVPFVMLEKLSAKAVAFEASASLPCGGRQPRRPPPAPIARRQKTEMPTIERIHTWPARSPTCIARFG